MLPQTAWLVFVSAAPVSITAFKQFEVDDFPFRAAPPRALRAEVGNRDRCPFESASVLPIQVLEAAVLPIRLGRASLNALREAAITSRIR